MNVLTCPHVSSRPHVQALSGELAVPDWLAFTTDVRDAFDCARTNTSGTVSTSNPVFAKANPRAFAVSVCTVDGQRLNFGDVDVEAPLSSAMKPLMYALSVETAGLLAVHNRVGIQPAGEDSTAKLDERGRCFNPMLTGGAIASAGCFKPTADVSVRFRQVMQFVNRMAGGAKINFNHSAYLCAHECNWESLALTYHMKEAGSLIGLDAEAEDLVYVPHCVSLCTHRRAHPPP